MADAEVDRPLESSHPSGVRLIIKNPYDGNDWNVNLEGTATLYDLKVKISKECKL